MSKSNSDSTAQNVKSISWSDKQLKLFDEVEQLYKDGYDYTIEFPNGKTLHGRYDMSEWLHHYKIPSDLSNKTVLDIGPANGYFSFEMAKRGAKVTGIDSYENIGQKKVFELMGMGIDYKFQDLTTLDESFGKFDIVFCSNVLQHNSDWFMNIWRIRKVTKKLAIICTSLIDDDTNDVPLMHFHGDVVEAPEKRYFSELWRPNMKCLVEMGKAAGFKKVEAISVFNIKRKQDTWESKTGVIHCHV